MSVYYKGKLISGIREIPHLTQSEYDALTNKPDLWIRTDAPDSDRGIDADDIDYDENNSVKDKIDILSDKVVLYIPGNTYSKYSEALTAIQTEYNKLSNTEKRRAVIVFADYIIANVFHITNGRFTYSLANAGANYIVSFELDTHKYYLSTIGASSTSFQDNSESAQVNAIGLMII